MNRPALQSAEVQERSWRQRFLESPATRAQTDND